MCHGTKVPVPKGRNGNLLLMLGAQCATAFVVSFQENAYRMSLACCRKTSITLQIQFELSQISSPVMFFLPVPSNSAIEMTLASKMAAFLVASILLHGFFFHGSAWKSYFFRVPGSTPLSVKVKVLVESLCSDSKRFVEGQLSEVYKALGPSVMDIQLIPFGNAKFVHVDGSGKGDGLVLQCQHGVAECDGNIYEQCVVMQLYPYAQRYLPFLRCLYDALPMGHSDELLDRNVVARCARESALDWTEIAACHDDEKQVALLQKRAKALTPSYHKGVPWVEVNGRHIELADDVTPFLKAICRAYISNGGSHPSCSSSLV